jgi:predicted component of type VI protein secretion system
MIPSQNNRKHSGTVVAALLLGLALGATSLIQGVVPEKATNTKMIKMIETAKTPADHKAIADHYKAEAALAEAKAAEHEEMAAAYKKSGFGTVAKTPNAPGTIDHCKKLAKSYKAMAEDLTGLAKEHEAMAAKAK